MVCGLGSLKAVMAVAESDPNSYEQWMEPPEEDHCLVELTSCSFGLGRSYSAGEGGGGVQKRERRGQTSGLTSRKLWCNF